MAPTYNQQPGKTEIFHMPSADATVPDLMSKDRPSHPVLTIVKGPQTGETFELDSTHISLGRDPKNSVFLNDMTVSRHHAQIDLSNLGLGYATIEDLNSLNGTWVDGAIQPSKSAPSVWYFIPANLVHKKLVWLIQAFLPSVRLSIS